MILSKAEIDILRLCAWCNDLPVTGCRNIPADTLDWLLALSLIRLTRQKSSYRITPIGLELLQKAGYRMEADGQYRSGAVLERRFRTAEIASFFWRMGVDVFGEAPPTERGSGQPQGVRRLEPHQAPGALRRNVIT